MLKRYVFSTITLVFFTSACSGPKSSTGTAPNTGVTAPGPTIISYCSTIQSPSPSATITGTAQFFRREIFGDSTPSTAGGLGAPGAARPIRYAEIRVTNSAGTEVQCGETSVTGTFSLSVPTTADTYTVSVRARSENTHLNARVLDTVDGGNLYALTASIAVTGAGTFALGTIQASATGDLLGGAFNILDQFLEANEYIRTKAGTGICSAAFTGCVDFTVAERVTAYWKKGLNPNSYYFGRNSGLSFYLPSYKRLFILGGINGNTDNSDTDHFDNSVILHEYGHFLEDAAFNSDSPGGTHSGTAMIDPRLAWSEGWGNFFQAAVRNDPYYIDTIGNSDGTTSFAFYVDLENQTGGLAYDHLDPVTDTGEGIFREFSVTRLLWDAVDAATDSAAESVSDKFVEIWASLTKNKEGLNNPYAAFRNAGHVHLAQSYLQTNHGASDWSSLRTLEKHTSGTSEYGQYVTTGSSCTYSITPVLASGTALTSSNYLKNNDFYHLRVTSATTVTIRLDYVDANAAGTIADLDLFIYNETARIGNSTDIVAYAWSDPVDTNGSGSITAADSQFETVTVSLAAGNYLINTNVYSADGASGAINYTIKLNGSELCPATLPNP